MPRPQVNTATKVTAYVLGLAILFVAALALGRALAPAGMPDMQMQSGTQNSATTAATSSIPPKEPV